MRFISRSAKETANIGKRLARRLKPGDILCLYGNLGAGKTVFVKGIARGLGINENKVISPSFVLIREHRAKIPLYHFDLYRLKNPKEIADLGYEEYLYGQGITAIEWADRLASCLPNNFIKVDFRIRDKNTRIITIRKCRL